MNELDVLVDSIPSAILDVRYATVHNIADVQLYKQAKPQLRKEPLQALVRIANELAASQYSIVIFDAFRPLSVQERLKQACDDTNYVAEVSNHCKGITVDITLADSSGNYLDMGTDYDDFTEKAHPGTQLISANQEANRAILTTAMNKQGFVQHPNEWWHFDYHPDLMWDLIDDESNTFATQ